MPIPITLEQANARLHHALLVGDTEQIERWDFIIRRLNDWRVKCKQRERAMRVIYI